MSYIQLIWLSKFKKKAGHSYICLKARWRRMPSHIEINLSYNQLKREMLYEFYFKLNTHVFWHMITTRRMIKINI